MSTASSFASMKVSGPLCLCCMASVALAGISRADPTVEVLSPCFVVKHVGDWFQGKSRELCTPAPDGRLKVIGSLRERNGIENQFALSADGQSVVFKSQWPTGKGKDRVEPGIHRYVCGVGDTLLHPERQCRSFTSTGSPQGLPRDVMLFGLADSLLNPHDAWFALRADGHETPLVLLDAPALHSAACEGRVASIDSLLGLGADPLEQNVLGMTAPDVALWAGHEDAAIRLIEAAPRDTATLQDFLSAAIQYGRWKTVGVLFERGADPNHPFVRRSGPFAPISPLMIALESPGNPQLSRFMFAAWSTEAVRSWEDLHEGVRFLLAHGANPNQCDPMGRTALHEIAASAEPVASTWIALNLESARILIGGGADPMLKTAKGNTPLHTLVGTHSDLTYSSRGFEATWGHDPYSQLLELYVSHTKNLEVRNAAGLTPLQRAIGAMNFLAARALVAHGASDEVEYNGHRVREILAEELKSHKSSLLDKVNAASSNPDPSRADKFRSRFPERYGAPPDPDRHE